MDTKGHAVKEIITKIVLAAAAVFGAALIFMGFRGLSVLSASGFSSENSYAAIYALSGDVRAVWKDGIAPVLKTLSPEMRASLDTDAADFLADTWEEAQTGGGDRVRSLLAESGDDDGKMLYELLYTTWLFQGPDIASAGKKLLTKSDSAIDAAQILLCLADTSAPLPDGLSRITGDLTGSDRKAVLLQAFFIRAGASRKGLQGDVNLFKKSIRDHEEQLRAFPLIAHGDISFLLQLIIKRSRTVILAGILLLIDVLLLALFMRADRRWILEFKQIAIVLIVDFLLAFQLLPMGYIIGRAVFPDGHLSLSLLQRLYTFPLNLEALKNTFTAAFVTMILGTVIAFPLAFLVSRTNLYGRKFFRSLFVITYMVPPYVGAMAWLRLTNPNAGTINQWLRAIFHLADAPGPLNVYTLPGLIWVLTTFYYPYAFITISRAMENMDPSLEEASRISGAAPIKTILTVTLPMMTPSLIAGALLVFVSAASCYGIPSIVGTPGNVSTVTTRIVEYSSLGQQGLNDATALAVCFMVAAIGLLFLSDVVVTRKQYITVSGKSVRPVTVDLRSFRIPLTILVGLFSVLVIFLPFVTIFTTSFKADIGKSMLATGNFTTKNWTTVFSRSETIGCLKNSLIFAAVSATVGLVISCVMSYLLQRTKVRGRNLPNFLITLGSGTPSVVIALGLIMTMRGNFGINIYGTAYIIIIAYLIKYMMMGMRTVVSAMSQIHISLEESSQVSGAGWLTTMIRITGPLIFPSIAAGWFLIFIPCFYELSMTTLLYSSTTKTIGFELFEYWSFTSQPMSCAMAFGILLFVVAINLILGKLTKGAFHI